MVHATIISTDALAARLGGDWAIVDCRYDLANEDWGYNQYLAGHIPGAAYASLSHDLSAERTGTNGRHPIPTHAAMAATFSRLGIGAGTQVVAYDQDSGMYASRLWWMLRYLGHNEVAVLDGGWAKWAKEGRPVRNADEARAPATFQPQPRNAQCLSVSDVERLVGDQSVLLVDARGPERFEGKSEPVDRVPGHIPGAANHFFRSNLAADGTLLPVHELRGHFNAMLAGHTPDQVVMYCGSGVTACQNLLAMEHAGLSGSRLYPGSWSEWSADVRRPVETGPGKTSTHPPARPSQ
ncbi:MAG: sulfurtransferase [Vicinamibacterales bacterium]